MRSRSGRECTDCFPELATLAEQLSRHRVILDGELLSFDADGTPNFHALRPRLLGRAGAAVVLADTHLGHRAREEFKRAHSAHTSLARRAYIRRLRPKLYWRQYP